MCGYFTRRNEQVFTNYCYRPDDEHFKKISDKNRSAVSKKERLGRSGSIEDY